MDVFISWSGERSRAFAEALRGWLPQLINAVQPWLSSTDIDAGARWGVDVANRLAAAKVGIICLTPGNVHADWILFEAGALSKTLTGTHVCPLLIDLTPADIKGPLAQFQAKVANRDGIRELVETINGALAQPRSPMELAEAFEVWWPHLDAKMKALPQELQPGKAARPDREILEEILALVRAQVSPVSELAVRDASLGNRVLFLKALAGAISADDLLARSVVADRRPSKDARCIIRGTLGQATVQVPPEIFERGSRVLRRWLRRHIDALSTDIGPPLDSGPSNGASDAGRPDPSAA